MQLSEEQTLTIAAIIYGETSVWITSENRTTPGSSYELLKGWCDRGWFVQVSVEMKRAGAFRVTSKGLHALPGILDKQGALMDRSYPALPKLTTLQEQILAAYFHCETKH
ncbi:hypothetical protein NGM99_13620 [Mesorhizobium sp. RP14(2022)]|uniref:Uncharacterized protein n=1 Tax=Mesorhizobium liriopis TaxID=2953882 RepID=A0ABT1C7K3_9HYPH|nr:hypothetical protein [Mesorhizobium liriopis]MCO6050817.1 hypothetical protein [Mesorhizobium liriopis]